MIRYYSSESDDPTLDALPLLPVPVSFDITLRPEPVPDFPSFLVRTKPDLHRYICRHVLPFMRNWVGTLQDFRLFLPTLLSDRTVASVLMDCNGEDVRLPLYPYPGDGGIGEYPTSSSIESVRKSGNQPRRFIINDTRFRGDEYSHYPSGEPEPGFPNGESYKRNLRRANAHYHSLGLPQYGLPQYRIHA